MIQAENFSDDIDNLRKQKHVGRNSDIIKLRPFIDENGILRVGGRIQQADLSFDSKHQILLPNRRFTVDQDSQRQH